jgi:four helix bundle protein
MRKHHELKAWQEAISLVTNVYQVTARFPKEELFGLTSQMRRAAVSIPSNVAEGAARSTDKEFLHFLAVARGSLSELETQAIIARNLTYLENDPAISSRMNNVFGLIGGLMKNIERRGSK